MRLVCCLDLLSYILNITNPSQVAIQYGMVVELIPEEMKEEWITQLLNTNTRITLLLAQVELTLKLNHIRSHVL